MSVLTQDMLDQMKKSFEAGATNKISQNAVMKNGLRASAINQDSEKHHQFVFSDDVDSEPVANQNKSGRCWMYAALNTLRYRIEKKYGLKDFELSQNYTFFYDKIEKANYFYENILRTADKSLDDREVVFLLNMPQQDGGDWCLISSVIQKYGVVPKSAMDETNCSITSMELDNILNKKLRQDAIALRAMVAAGASAQDIETKRFEMLNEIYRILAIALGNPPEKVRFEYRDKDNTYHISNELTPKEFYDNYVGVDLNDYVGIINIPSSNVPMNKKIGVAVSGNMVNGLANTYLNIGIDRMKEMTIAQLKDGEPVWFGCDVLQSSSIELGIMATDLYNLEELLDIKFTMDKGERFDYRESLPTHAMTIAGVDIIDGKPVNWKVENSWGPNHPDKGYLVMSDDWYTQYNYEVVINKKYLNKDELALLDTEAYVLPYWNTMNPI